MPKISIEAEKDTWQYLRLASDHSFEIAQQSASKEQNMVVDHPDPLLEGMKALLCRAVAFEGLVNSVGRQKCPAHWWRAVERNKVKEKLALICNELAISIDFTAKPFSQWTRIEKFRNAMSHPRRTTGKRDAHVSSPSKAGALTGIPVVDWERECVQPELEKNVKAIDQMIEELIAKTKFKVEAMGRARGHFVKG